MLADIRIYIKPGHTSIFRVFPILFPDSGTRPTRTGSTGTGPTRTGPTGNGPNWTDQNQTDWNQTAWTRPDWSDIRGAEASHRGSRIKDLGLCVGLTWHRRRDTDVISRLSESTIQDLSFFRFYKDPIKDQGSWTLSRILDLVLA